MVFVALADVSLQAFAHGTGAEDEQRIVRGQPSRDLIDESIEVLEAVRLAGGLRPPAAMADAGIVPDMARGPVTSRHLRLHLLESSPVVLPTDDDSLPSVDRPPGPAGSA